MWSEADDQGWVILPALQDSVYRCYTVTGKSMTLANELYCRPADIGYLDLQPTNG